jgi:serine/threonine protein phosphatase PrpC
MTAGTVGVTVVVTVTAMTCRGLVRQANEDRVGVFGWCAPAEMSAPVSLRAAVDQPLVVVVADGLGGHPAGEVASAMAVEQCMADPVELAGSAGLTARLQSIHSGLLEAGRADQGRTGMATTLTAVVVTPDRVRVVNVGDSRAYYVEPGFVEQLTDDDVDPSGSGALSQVLGGRADRDIDPKAVTTELQDGIRLLLCTDGLHSYTDPGRLRELLDAADDPAVIVAALHESVRQAGAPDNVSVCLVDIAVSEARDD